jgi:hypothetical protein
MKAFLTSALFQTSGKQALQLEAPIDSVVTLINCGFCACRARSQESFENCRMTLGRHGEELADFPRGIACLALDPGGMLGVSRFGLGTAVADEVRQYSIPDFSRWKEHDAFATGSALAA